VCFYKLHGHRGVALYQQSLIYGLRNSPVTVLITHIDKEILLVVAVGNPKERIKPLIPWHKFVPVAEMPLAYHARGITGGPQDFSNRYFSWR